MKPAGHRAIGIDLGGTALKAGALEPDGAPGESRTLPTQLERGPEDLVERMARAARELGAGRSVGLAVPGLLDRDAGVVLASPNLKAIEGYALRDELARRLGLAPRCVAFENDANAAALGEHRAGAARDERDFVMVTLGTGVGGGIVLRGELVVGEGGLGGEVGHVVVDPRGPLCGCGSHGCLEQYASATAAMRRARERGLDEDLVRLSGRARQEDGPERRLLHEIGADLGRGLAAAATLLDVRCFVVGGGFGAALDLLREGVLAGLAERTFGRARDDWRLVPAALGGDAGWIGAAAIGADAAG